MRMIAAVAMPVATCLATLTTGQAPAVRADLRHVAILWREVGSGTRAVLERALLGARRDIAVRYELGSTEAIKSAVIAGMGVGFPSQCGRSVPKWRSRNWCRCRFPGSASGERFAGRLRPAP
jgi:DNA-binding transcriptional LysR family regulator